jgi:DNA-binding NtrC family response regulator
LGGTLLLKEVAAAGAEFQQALRRVLDNGEFRPVGAAARNELDLRPVATTSRILGMEAAAGRFSRDLVRNLAEVIIRIPPLRERPEAVLPLARSFISSHDGGERNHAIAPSAEQALLAHDWPRNVGELQTRLERALILCEGRDINIDLLGLESAAQDAREPSARHRELNDCLDSLAAARLKQALLGAGGDERVAAGKLRVNPAMMPRIRSRFGI